MPEAKLLERAYEVARSGEVGNVDELIAALGREGYRQLEVYFTYTSLRRDLNMICRAAWAAAGHPRLADPRRGKTGAAARSGKSGPPTASETAVKRRPSADGHE